MIYFTSDTHFDHGNVIKYCERPFRDVDDMNQTLVDRWNARVRPSDTVFHLGDFCMKGAERIKHWRSQLNGRVVLLRGNHDRSLGVMAKCGFEPFSKLAIDIAGHTWWMAHIPNPHLGPRQLCGHVHEAWRFRRSAAGCIFVNVGVDQWNYAPVSYQELEEYMLGLEA